MEQKNKIDHIVPDNNTKLLVSIIVITYNSARYVLDTLESAKAQSYRNIELIISDDCSVDNTIDLCNEWLEKNKGRFVRTKLITSSENTGTSANCNRGLREANGEWIKLIAGDDVLMEQCIEKNVHYVTTHPEVTFLFSRLIVVNDQLQEIGRWGIEATFFDQTAKIQYKKLLRGNLMLAPSSFIKRSVLEKLGGFDERIRLIEDYPMWIKATRAGYKLSYMDEYTVLYRKPPKANAEKEFFAGAQSDLLKIITSYRLRGINFKNAAFLLRDWIFLKTINHPLQRLVLIFRPFHLTRFLYNKIFDQRKNKSHKPTRLNGFL